MPFTQPAPGAQQRTSSPEHRARRARVLARDRGICHLCGQPGATHADHITPLALGGADDESNMAAAHATCHARKSGREGNAVRWANPDARARRPRESHPGLIE